MMALFNNTETSSNIRLQYLVYKKTAFFAFIGLLHFLPVFDNIHVL